MTLKENKKHLQQLIQLSECLIPNLLGILWGSSLIGLSLSLSFLLWRWYQDRN